MSLKTRFFEKGLIKADLKRFWLFGLIYTAAVFFVTFFGFYIDKSYNTALTSEQYVNSLFFDFTLISNFGGVTYGALLAPMLFSFLNSTSAVSFYHGLPLSRKKIFVSKLGSAFILLTLPILINTSFVLLTKLFGSDIPIRTQHILTWTYIQLVYSYIAFACMTFTAVISGNILAHILSMGLCTVAPALIVSFIHELCSVYLLGYNTEMNEILKYIYILPDQMATLYILIYFAATVILLLLSYFIYKARPLERSGEAFVFKGAKLFLVYIGALLGGIISYWYFSIWFDKSVFFMLPFGIAAIVVANMLNKRGITLRGAFLHIGIFLLFVLALFGGFKGDILNFETRVPDANAVSSVIIGSDRPYIRTSNDKYYYRQYGSFQKLNINPDFKISDKEDIEKVIKYHKFKIDEGNMTKEPGEITIIYELKNGRRISRRYRFEKNADKQYFEPVASLEKVKRQRYELYHNDSVDIEGFVVSPLTEHRNAPSINISKSDVNFEELCKALDEDISVLPYDEDASLCAGMSFTAPVCMCITYMAGDDDTMFTTYDYFITDGFVRTMEVLKKCGFDNIRITSDNVLSIGIDRGDSGGALRLNSIPVDEIVTDPAAKAEIIDKIAHSYRNNFSPDASYNDYIFILDNGDTLYFTSAE